MTESGYYYYTHPFTEDERLSLKEFFGRDLFDGSYKELSDEQIDQISARIMPRARSSIRVSDLLAPLRKLKALSDTEYSHLRSGSLEAEEQAVRLMEYLMYKGSYGLASLYLSLLTSSESKRGLPAHYQLARELREIVQEYGVTEESSGDRLEGLTNGTEAQTIPLSAAVKKLQGVRLSPETAQTLASHLNLPPHQRVSADLCELCVQWLKSRSICDMMELVEGMVATEGLGRYTTHLCGPSSESPRDLRNFLLTLGERWVEIARYLGFSQEEIDAIMHSYPYSIGKQVEEFLEEWKMPDSGQKTLPLMHKLKALAGIVEPKRDRADSLPSGRRPWLDDSGVPPRRLDPYPHPHKRPHSPPRTPDNHHHHNQHNSHHCHHSHSGHHVHSFHHHQDCPFHNAVDKPVEGYYDDYENAPYSSYSGTLPVGSKGQFHFIVSMSGGGGGDSRKSYHKQSSRSHYTANDDPVIEELPSDSEPHSKPQRAITGSEVTIPDQPTLSSSSSSSSTKRPTPSRPPTTSPGSARRGGVRTEPHARLGNEVFTERSSSLDGVEGRGGFEQGNNLSTPLGNEVLMEGHPSSSSALRGSVERVNLSTSLGNEVLIESRPSSNSVRGLHGGNLSPLGNEVLLEGPPSISNGHFGGMGRGVDLPSPLGNEVLMEGSPHSMGGSGRGIERENSSATVSAPLGNEVIPPGLTNEISVGRMGGQGRANRGRNAEATMGNEVSLLAGRLDPKKQAVHHSSTPHSSPLLSPGNEVPMPGAGNRFAVGAVDNGLLSVQPSALPSSAGSGTGSGDRRGGMANEAESSDSGVSEMTSVSSTPQRRPLMSDSSSVDSSSGVSSRVSVVHKPSGPGTLPGIGRSSGGVVEGFTAPPNSRSPSPDNDFTSGDEDESSSFKSHSQPSSRSTFSLAPALNLSSLHTAAAAQPTSLSTITPPIIASSSSTVAGSPNATLSPGVSQHHNTGSHSTEEPNLYVASPRASSGLVTMSNELSVGQSGVRGSTRSGGVEGRGMKLPETDDGDNDLDFGGDEDEGVSRTPVRMSPPLDLAHPPTPPPPLESSETPENLTQESEGKREVERTGGGGEEVGNNLSVLTPETPDANRVSAQVFMQTPFSLTPDNDAPIAGMNDLSTVEGATPETSTTTAPPAESKSANETGEFCSEDVLQSVRERDGLDMLTALVESGASLNLPGPDGAYPIHVAVAHRHHETVLFLLGREACIEQRRSDGKTPLHVACLTRDFEMVQILVEKGADLGAKDSEGYTCMHLRETLETLNLVKYLAIHGAPIDTPSQESYLTPLMMCCHIGDETFETAQFLLSKGARVNGYPQAGMKPLIIACTEGFEVLVDLLLEYNADINIQDNDGNTALLKVCQSGSVSLARKLCERRSDSSPSGANVNLSNNEGLTPMLAAVLRNGKELVILLVTHGATVNCYKQHKMRVGGCDRTLEVSPLSCAASSGHMDMVSLLVQNEARINATPTAMAPVAIAAMCGQLAVVRYFLNLNDLDLSLPALAQPFIEAIKANQFECAEEIAAKKYSNLDEMLTAAQQDEMRELVDSIKQLQQKVPASSVHPSSAPPTSSGSTTLPPAQQQSSAPSNAATIQATSLPSQPGPNRASTNEHSLSPAGLREGEDENNLDLEDSLPPSTGSGVALTLVSSAAPSASDRPGSTTPFPSQVRDPADENNLNDEDPLIACGEGSFPPTVPLVSQPPSAPDPPRTFTAQAQVRDFADENNLRDEDPVTPSRGTITPQTLPVLPVVPPASLLTVPNPTSLSEADENNFDASTPPGEGSTNQTVPLVPSPTSDLHNLGRGRVLSETDENNLDDEDPLSPLLQTTSAITTASVSLVSSQPSVVQGPGPLSTTSLPPKIEENNLDGEDPCSPSALAVSSSAAASLPSTFPPTGTSPLEFTVTPSKPSLPTSSYDNLDAANNLNAGDESTEGQIGGARGGASSVVAGNLLYKPTAPPVVAQTASDPVAALKNLDTYSQNDENNLNKDDDTPATGLGAVGAQQNPGNSGTVVTNSLNPEFSSVGVSRVASGTVAAQDVIEENNLDEEDMLARARVARVEPSVPVERIEVDRENEDSLTSCTVSRAQESGISRSNSGSGQTARSLATSNNLEFSGEQTASGVAAAVESKNLGIARQPLASDATAMNNLGVDQPGSSPTATAANDLSVEGPSQVVQTLQMQSPFEAGSHTASNMSNNLDSEEFDQERGLHNQLPVLHGSAADNFGNVVSQRHGRAGDVVGTRVVQEQQNNLSGQNDLDSDEDSTPARNSGRSVGRDEHTINNFDEPESSQSSQPVRILSLPPRPSTSTHQPSVAGTTSLPASNTIHTPPAVNSSSIPSDLPACAPLRAGATSGTASQSQHFLTEKNQFDEGEENDFSRDDAASGNQDGKRQGPPLLTSAPTQRHVRWVASLEEDDREGSEKGHPLPTSAPVGHSSGVPLRASVDSSSFTTTPPVSVAGGENLFAPRPKSPPTRAPSPPRPSPYNMLNMADGAMGGLGGSGGSGGSIEVLHDFAQICMVAADRIKGHEWLINKAIETGYDHLTEFFIKYFHEGMSLSIGGKLVSEFIGGNPSPLNFLLAGGFINQAIFEEAARDLGQPEFTNDLAVALHQFPGSDGLPYTGGEMAEALFSQSFSIGHRYPNPSSLSSSSSSLPPLNTPASTTQQQPSFPGTGHPLGHGSSSLNYSSPAEPPSLSSSSFAAPFSAQGSASYPQQPSPSSSPSHSDSKTVYTGTSSSSDSKRQTSSLEAHSGSSLPTGPCPPPDAKLSVFSSTSSLSQPSSSGGLPLHSTGRSLTEENTFHEESGAQNDLTTDEEDSGDYYPRQPPAKDHGPDLLGNEIDVKPVSHLQTTSSTTAAMSSTPHSAPHSAHPSSATLPHNVTPLTPSHPHPSHSITQLTPLPSPSPPLNITTDERHPTSLPKPLPRSVPLAPLAPARSASSGKGEEIDRRPLSLTPSPDPIPNAPSKKPPTLVLKIQHPIKAVAPSSSGSDAVSPQSSSGFQSPRSLSPTPQGPPPITAAATKPPKLDPHPDEGSSEGGKQHTTTKETDGKPLRGSEMRRTPKTVFSGSPPTTRSKPTASSKSPTDSAVPTSLPRKKTQPVTSSKPRAPTSAPTSKGLIQTVSPKVGSKLAKAPSKPPSSASPRVTKKTTSTQSGNPRETGPLAMRVKKPQPPAGKSSSHTSTKPSSRTTKKASPLQTVSKSSSTQPLIKSSRSTSLHPTSKPFSTHPTSKPSSLHASSKTRVTRTSGTAGPTQTVVPSATVLASRGLHKSKTGMSKSSLPDEEQLSTGSMPSIAQEQVGGSHATSPASSGRYSDVMVGGPSMRLGDVTSFPDTVIRDPETCPLLKALTHRIQKWKMFGRYLGLSDQELHDIEKTNHFTTERCFKMLVTWGRNFNGKYSELEAGIHNIMREDLVEDVRPLLPLEQTDHYGEEEEENVLRFTRFSMQDDLQNFNRLTKSVTKFLRGRLGNHKKIVFRLSHERLNSPLEIYLPPPSNSDCDLTVVQELCFAAQCRSVSTVDLVFEVKS